MRVLTAQGGSCCDIAVHASCGVTTATATTNANAAPCLMLGNRLRLKLSRWQQGVIVLTVDLPRGSLDLASRLLLLINQLGQWRRTQ